jgi:hypothetical protein
MAWNPNIPNPTDVLSQSQADIKGNFQALDPLFSNGIQDVVDLPVQALAPTLPAGDVGIYNLNYATTAKNELFVHKITNAGTADIPLTASILSTVTAPTAFSSGYTYLPSGILLRWEQGSGTGGVTMTLGGGFPAFNGIITAIVCPVNSSSGDVNFAVRLKTIISTTQLSFYVSSRTSTGAGTGSFNVLIIGY